MARHRSTRLQISQLPFVALRGDGRLGFWVVPEPGPGNATDPRLLGRTYAGWFLLFEEANGAAAADDLLTRIGREMPSARPEVDAAFQAALADRAAPRPDGPGAAAVRAPPDGSGRTAGP
ncbi:hypothetical protein [Rhodospirillum centenum]|nr:hypothetical protein [Rhodospirillum centenum]